MPQGKTLLARCDGVVCGGGTYRRLPDGSCEMKRLFVGFRDSAPPHADPANLLPYLAFMELPLGALEF